jgi:signal transduction histidine kinase
VRSSRGEKDPGFKVKLPGELDAEDALDLAGKLLGRAWATLTIDVEDDQLRFKVVIVGVEEPFTLKRKFTNIVGKGLHADIRFFPRRAGVFRGSGVDGRKAWAWVRENCGVAIIDHGFRIRPYGFENDDWLQLDLDSAHNRRDWRSGFSLKHFPIAAEIRARPGDNPALNLPYNFQLVGAVFVESVPAGKSDSKDLIPSMDREGFLQNEGYGEVVDVVRAGIEYLALVDKQELTRRHEEAAERAAKAARADFKSAIANIRESPTLSSGDKARLVEHYADLATKLDEVEEYGRDARRKLEVMGLLGVVAGFMTHEAVRILEGLEQCIKSLEPLLVRHPNLAEPLKTVQDGYRTFKGHVDYTSMFVDAMHRDNAKPFKAAPQVRRIVDRFGEFANDRGVVVVNEIASDLVAPAVPISVYSGVLLNLYTNALKSVLAAGKLSKPPHIVFRAWNENGRHFVEVLDRGIGIPPELKQRVFDPLFTTTSNIGNPLGSGMGLGLSLVKEVMNHIGGKITIVDAPKNFLTCFRVEFGEKK